MASWFQMTVG